MELQFKTLSDKLSFEHRSDDRAPKLAGEYWKEYSSNEGQWIILFRENMLRIYDEIKDIVIEDYGCDNSGEIISDSKRVNAKPDFYVTFHFKTGGVHRLKIDVKAMKESSYAFSLKEDQRKTYLEEEAWVLVPAINGYWFFSHDAVKYIYSTFEKRKVGAMGGKEAYPMCYPYELNVLLKEYPSFGCKGNWNEEEKDIAVQLDKKVEHLSYKNNYGGRNDEVSDS